MADQYQLYDAAVLGWIKDTFGGLVQNKTLTVMVGTADRAFADYVTLDPQRDNPSPPDGLNPAGRPRLPRIALTIGEGELDPERFNSNEIRKLGFALDSKRGALRRATYPTPITIPYTLNFWTEYEKEMNLYKQELLKGFRFQYVYIPVNIDMVSPYPVYGTKDVGMFADSGIVNSGNTPDVGQKAERVVRRTFSFHMKAWLWDVDFRTATVVREVETQFYSDKQLTTLLETARAPQRHTLIASDGVTTYYGPILVNQNVLPIVHNTFLIDATVNGENVRGRDDGNGNIIGVGPNAAMIQGTVNYTTGAVIAQYTVAPDASTDITVAYYTKE